MTRKRILAILSFAGLVAVLGIVAGLTVFQDSSTAPVAIAPTAAPTSTPQPGATPTPVPPSNAPVVRLQIPRIGVDAGVVSLGVDPDGTMQSPAMPMEVGWYRFASLPGHGGNVVMSGHVDYLRFGPAVFYRLRELQEGDRIVVALEDGASFAYEVTSLTTYGANDPVLDAVGPTPTEAVTLITCAGAFNSASRQYDRRLVVRGHLVETATAR
jgi:LPXTG-site transpeptidase (sortase) family protein